ncbi:stage II sporulation protein M [Lapillicoccus jejuensis]|uniref:Stage II sporulation protein M n=1 Tax=Lapillicoccus jejuensis TaxID=402171 RepID=A0A542E3P5_9MICO|nr:stage II sporulation protein M [Lapillicoccus jejuensis]TQJ09945.1 stage II sporulation protein M [Lapillicoccus jejuensis]
MTALVHRPLQIVRDERRPFLALNAVAFGLVLLGLVLGLAVPSLHQSQVATLDQTGQTDLVLRVFRTPWLFALTILGVNTLTVGAALIVLPSMVVPFLGIVLFGWKALTIGMALAPTSPTLWVAFIPHSLTVVVEFEAYVLLLLGAWVLGRSWLRPASLGATSRRRAYLLGLQRLGWLSAASFVLLVVGAVWEAYSLTQLLPWLVHTLVGPTR